MAPKTKTRKSHAHPEIWGQGTWVLLHCVTATYPLRVTPAVRDRYEQLLYSLSETLPCKKCRKHFAKHLTLSPPSLESRKAFMKWMIDFHNNVNHRLGKPVLTYREAYLSVRRTCPHHV